MSNQITNEIYIRLTGGINSQSMGALTQVLSQIGTQPGKIHLMISTPGGDVFHGITAYNTLKSHPAEIWTYNMGSIDSIGLVLFCAGSCRHATQNTRFLIHPVGVNFSGNVSMDEHSLREQLNSVRADQENIIGIISDATKQGAEDIKKLMQARSTFTPTKAKEIGLIDKVVPPSIPPGTKIVDIYEMPQPAPLNPKGGGGQGTP